MVKMDSGTASITTSDGYLDAVAVNVNRITLSAGFGTDKLVVALGILNDSWIARAQSVVVYP